MSNWRDERNVLAILSDRAYRRVEIIPESLQIRIIYVTKSSLPKAIYFLNLWTYPIHHPYRKNRRRYHTNQLQLRGKKPILHLILSNKDCVHYFSGKNRQLGSEWWRLFTRRIDGALPSGGPERSAAGIKDHISLACICECCQYKYLQNWLLSVIQIKPFHCSPRII